MQHKGGNAVRAQPGSDVVAFVIDPYLGVSSARGNDHGRAGGDGAGGKVDGDRGLLHGRDDVLPLWRDTDGGRLLGLGGVGREGNDGVLGHSHTRGHKGESGGEEEAVQEGLQHTHHECSGDQLSGR